MTSYLDAGWFQHEGKKGLRTEVIDGAMDAAGMLLRAGVSPELVLRVALRVRALMIIADPQVLSVGRFSDDIRARFALRLERYTNQSPELHAFVADCLERTDNLSDLMAFYLHLTHVARMIQLLKAAVHQPDGGRPKSANRGKRPTRSRTASKRTKIAAKSKARPAKATRTASRAAARTSKRKPAARTAKRAKARTSKR